MQEFIQAATDAMKSSMAGMLVRVKRVVSVDDTTPLQQLSIKTVGDDNDTDVEHLQPYGLAYNPPAGSEGLRASIGGDRASSVVLLVGHRKYRVRGLEQGEAALFAQTDAGMTRINLKKDGSVEIVPANGKLLVEADVQVNGKVNTTGDVVAGTISLQNHTHPQNNGNHFGGGTPTGAAQ
jgi:phage gp45-like